jgi:exopolyphosphatase/guanosine-5'-triphosphate,3'-diphosphate pyrophosphatase
MIQAAIDVGSNSVRMLLTEGEGSTPRHFRQITRLAGDFKPQTGLAAESMVRTLSVLEQFATVLRNYQVERLRIVGTAALRNALNSDVFIAQVRQRTGLTIEIIDGATEARLSCRGILSVLKPPPQRALLFDIGGGSTEIILFDNARICFQQSFPLGVVRLFENYPESERRLSAIQQGLTPFVNDPIWREWQQDELPIELIGTAGTVSTLAALKLEMSEYDAGRVNNLVIERSWLEKLSGIFAESTLEERAALPGMEKGRADIMVPGLQIVRSLLDITGSDALRISDAGLLEGLLLE